MELHERIRANLIFIRLPHDLQENSSIDSARHKPFEPLRPAALKHG